MAPNGIPSSASSHSRSFTKPAAAVPDRYRVLVLTAGLGGLRQGELFALRRADVDLLHACVAVRRKRLLLASGEVIENSPKSEAGRRRVAPPKPLCPGAGAAPCQLRQRRRRELCLHVCEREAARARQLPIAGVDTGHPRRWTDRPSLPRPSPRRGHARRRAPAQRRRS